MKQKVKKPLFNLGLNAWLIIECIFIVIGSICIYEFCDYVYYHIFEKNPYYNPISGIGMFLPMSILTGLISYAFSKFFYRYISELTNAINKIASGEFNTKLNEQKGGPLTAVYHNFNIMSDELASIDTLRNDFVNEFSHEFKTPLASINGFSNLLLENECTEEQRRKYLTIIAAESERLVALTQNQLLLSKLDSQNIIMDKETYALDEQLRQSVILCASEWEKKKLNISIDLSPISFYGSKDLMQNIWMNLLNNAIKYTPENGEISIRSEQSDHTIRISICDTGIGIDENELEHIWGKYYQVKNSTSAKGLGLGLPIVKRIVELHKGTITAKSRAGEGSTFIVTLPFNK